MTLIPVGRSRGDMPAIGRCGADVDLVRVASPENSVELALSEPFELMIFNAEIIVGTLAMVVAAIRDEMSASRTTSPLVLAEPGKAEAARDLIGRDVNRVMLLDDPPELIGQQVAELLNVAPRAAIRLTVRLETFVAEGAVEVLGNVVNLSASGMLVETDTLFEPEEQVVVSINLGDQWGSVSAKAVVARQAHHDRGGVNAAEILQLFRSALEIVPSHWRHFHNCGVCPPALLPPHRCQR
jgi:hypothetical protein